MSEQLKPESASDGEQAIKYRPISDGELATQKYFWSGVLGFILSELDKKHRSVLLEVLDALNTSLSKEGIKVEPSTSELYALMLIATRDRETTSPAQVQNSGDPK